MRGSSRRAALRGVCRHPAAPRRRPTGPSSGAARTSRGRSISSGRSPTTCGTVRSTRSTTRPGARALAGHRSERQPLRRLRALDRHLPRRRVLPVLPREASYLRSAPNDREGAQRSRSGRPSATEAKSRVDQMVAKYHVLDEHLAELEPRVRAVDRASRASAAACSTGEPGYLMRACIPTTRRRATGGATPNSDPTRRACRARTRRTAACSVLPWQMRRDKHRLLLRGRHEPRRLRRATFGHAHRVRPRERGRPRHAHAAPRRHRHVDRLRVKYCGRHHGRTDASPSRSALTGGRARR